MKKDYPVSTSHRPNNLSLVLRVWQKKKKCPNNKKEIYNDKYKQTRDSLFGLHESMSINRLNIVTLQHCQQLRIFGSI